MGYRADILGDSSFSVLSSLASLSSPISIWQHITGSDQAFITIINNYKHQQPHRHPFLQQHHHHSISYSPTQLNLLLALPTAHYHLPNFVQNIDECAYTMMHNDSVDLNCVYPLSI